MGGGVGGLGVVVGGGLLRGADNMGGYHGLGGSFGGGGGHTQMNFQQLLDEKRILETNSRIIFEEKYNIWIIYF